MENFRGAKRLNEITESETLAMAKKVRALKATGIEIINFTLGEPDFPTPQHILNGILPFLQKGQIKYPPVAGIPELREAVAHFFQKYSNIPYQTQNILISTGAKQSLYNAIMSLVDPGDEVIIPTPYWVSYVAMVQLAGGIPIFIPTSHLQNFKITPEQLEKAISPRTKLLIYSSPSNPTGAIYSKKELEAIAHIILKHPNLFVIADEIYQLIAYDEKPTSLASLDKDIFERTITINGVSKAFAMTGWRIGFLGAPQWITSLCEKYQGQVTSGANLLAQHAALIAVSSDLQPTLDMQKAFLHRRNIGIQLFHELLPNIAIAPPAGAFYFFPNISPYLHMTTPNKQTINNDIDLSNYLLDHGVATIPGNAFGAPNYIRLSFACHEQHISQGINTIANALNSLHII